MKNENFNCGIISVDNKEDIKTLGVYICGEITLDGEKYKVYSNDKDVFSKKVKK